MPLRPFYIPWDDNDPIAHANKAAADWLNQQPGQGLIITDQVAAAKRARFPDMCNRGTLIVGAKNDVRLRDWRGGAVVFSSPTRRLIDKYRHVMARASGVLIVEWAPEPEVTAWLREEEAINILDAGDHTPAACPVCDDRPEEGHYCADCGRQA